VWTPPEQRSNKSGYQHSWIPCAILLKKIQAAPSAIILSMIWRALSKTGLPSIKELHDLLRSDNKRPDGLTLIPWRDGRCATWNVTVTDAVAPSYLSVSSACVALAAEAAAKRKEDK